MPDDTVEYSDLSKLRKALAQLTGPLLEKFKGRITYAVAGQLRTVLQKQPGESHSPVQWASEKSRRWYFWARKQAGLPLKYTRESDPWSQQSAKKWDISRQPTSAVLGNRASYASWVQSSQYQTGQHQATDWMTDDKAVRQIDTDGTMKRIIDAHIHAIVKEAFRGLM